MVRVQRKARGKVTLWEDERDHASLECDAEGERRHEERGVQQIRMKRDEVVGIDPVNASLKERLYGLEPGSVCGGLMSRWFERNREMKETG